MEFGEAVAEARAYREMTTLTALSRAMGRNPQQYSSYIAQIERGQVKPSVAIVVEIAKALDVIFACRPDGWSFRPVK